MTPAPRESRTWGYQLHTCVDEHLAVHEPLYVKRGGALLRCTLVIAEL